MFSSGPKYQKLTTNLRLAINRLKLLEKKKTEIAVKSRKEISDYLAAGKDERARIRVEHIIREDYLVEGMEIIEMYCDLLLARMGLIQSAKELDEGLEEPIATILWACPRLQSEVAELKVISDQFTAKYGKEFAQSCRTNELGNVNEKVVHKLGVQAPPKALIEKYLEEIARTYNVPYVPDPEAIMADETLLAEGMLIDFENKSNQNRGGGGGGGGGQMQPMQPFQTPGASYPADNPPAQHPYVPVPPPAGDMYPPPPLPSVPPAAGPAGSYPPPGGSYPPPGGSYPPPDASAYPPGPPPSYQPPPPSDAGPLPPKLPDFPDLPELPSVPAGTIPGASSTRSEDVDFDDLTKRFEELKKKK